MPSIAFVFHCSPHFPHDSSVCETDEDLVILICLDFLVARVSETLRMTVKESAVQTIGEDFGG